MNLFGSWRYVKVNCTYNSDHSTTFLSWKRRVLNWQQTDSANRVESFKPLLLMALSLLELRLISCRDVKAFNLFKKLCISATVSIINQHPNDKNKASERYQKQKTQVDKEGDGYADWNHQMTFDLREISCLDLENLFLDFDLKCEGIVYGNNTVGRVRVPIKELVRQDCKGSVCYQVMSTEGRHNGVLDFSYKVIHLDDNDDKVPENRDLPTPVIDQIPENRYQPTPSIYPSLESIELNYVPLAMPEVEQLEISPESIYPSVDTFPVLPEKPHVYFRPPVEVNNYYSPPSPFVYSPVTTTYWSNGTAFPGYNYNAGDLYPSVHSFQTYSNFAPY